MGFNSEMIRDIMRLVVAVLYAGNMTFTETSRGETCILDENEASLAVASLLGCSYEKLAASLTSRVLFLKEGNITKELNAKQAYSELSLPALAFEFADDHIAPKAATRKLYDSYPSLQIDVRRKSAGKPAIGHMGFFRESCGHPFWEEQLTWMANKEPAIASQSG